MPEPQPPETDAADFLLNQIQRTKALRLARAANPEREPKRVLLRKWQAARLARTHADLLAAPATRPAAEFFLSELYGVKDNTRRDDSVARVYPVMKKMLPDAALHGIGLALELDVLSEELDARLLDVLVGQLELRDKITEDMYVEAYRHCDNYDLRKHQIALVTSVGSDLAHIVSKPVIARTLRAMRVPARMAGFGELQNFLERGFEAFRNVSDPQAFLDTIEKRETQILDRIYARKPNPFGTQSREEK